MPNVAKLLALTYPGVSIDVVFDGGEATESAGKSLPGSVRTWILTRLEIECCSTQSAVDAWLALEGADTRAAVGFAEAALLGRAAEELEAISHRTLDRGYRQVSDGRMIGGLMSEGDLAVQQKETLIAVFAPE